MSDISAVAAEFISTVDLLIAKIEDSLPGHEFDGIFPYEDKLADLSYAMGWRMPPIRRNIQCAIKDHVHLESIEIAEPMGGSFSETLISAYLVERPHSGVIPPGVGKYPVTPEQRHELISTLKAWRRSVQSKASTYTLNAPERPRVSGDVSGEGVIARQDRSRRWRELIEQPPVLESETVMASAAGIQQLLTEFHTAPAGDHPPEIDQLFTDLLCKAIHAGAFSGSEWLLWRTRLAVNPHIVTAVLLLERCAPVPFKWGMPGGSLPESIKAATTVVGVIREYLRGKRDTDQPRVLENRKAARPGRPVDSDPDADRRIFDAWGTHEYRVYADLANNLGITSAQVRAAIDRHRKRVKPAE